MFICPTCEKGFSTEQEVVKHYLSCWKKHNPVHKPTAAPRKEDIEIRDVDENTLNFFASLERSGYARSNG